MSDTGAIESAEKSMLLAVNDEDVMDLIVVALATVAEREPVKKSFWEGMVQRQQQQKEMPGEADTVAFADRLRQYAERWNREYANDYLKNQGVLASKFRPTDADIALLREVVAWTVVGLLLYEPFDARDAQLRQLDSSILQASASERGRLSQYVANKVARRLGMPERQVRGHVARGEVLEYDEGRVWRLSNLIGEAAGRGLGHPVNEQGFNMRKNKPAGPFFIRAKIK